MRRISLSGIVRVFDNGQNVRSAECVMLRQQIIPLAETQIDNNDWGCLGSQFNNLNEVQ